MGGPACLVCYRNFLKGSERRTTVPLLGGCWDLTFTWCCKTDSTIETTASLTIRTSVVGQALTAWMISASTSFRRSSFSGRLTGEGALGCSLNDCPSYVVGFSPSVPYSEKSIIDLFGEQNYCGV